MIAYQKPKSFYSTFERKAPGTEATHYCPGCGHGNVHKLIAEAIDDFGVQRDTDWEKETLYNLVDARYEAEKFTLFTSNNNPTQVMKDPRVLSRLREMCRIMELAGEDHREKL